MRANRQPQPSNESQIRDWMWKAGAVLRCLAACKTDRGRQRFMARELRDAYEAGKMYDLARRTLGPTPKPASPPCDGCGSPTMTGCACG